MISNNNITPHVIEALNDLMKFGCSDLRMTMEKLFNALMVIERECVLQAGPYERSELRQGHANGFKDKTLHTRCGDLHEERDSDNTCYGSGSDRSADELRGLHLESRVAKKRD